ncbi:hypothetical protein [Pelagibaculum spongiae]|uniref:Uncharacterized protein n=1 Tax=Pelagibaculum spongiae TaxID=2080658 RepID=A0A2V1GTR9_9GAMM|nr:hypothetical protein [Pelagibaculum spongiae]PVZ68404.1 hypothetical protein DC094_14090 [Pelagibaculum spongiae]
MKKFLLLCLIALAQPVLAEPTVNPMYDNLIKMTLNNFWGRAVIPDGDLEKLVQPDSEQERKQLPIKAANAYAVLDAGKLSAMANWCRLNWQQHYDFVNLAAKNNYMNEKQIAFINVLHDVSMQITEDSLEGECSDSEKTAVIVALDQSIASPIAFGLSFKH